MILYCSMCGVKTFQVNFSIPPSCPWCYCHTSNFLINYKHRMHCYYFCLIFFIFPAFMNDICASIEFWVGSFSFTTVMALSSSLGVSDKKFAVIFVFLLLYILFPLCLAVFKISQFLFVALRL